MEGKFEHAGNSYEWWAGSASPDAEEDYCVHTRKGDWGVTRYVSTEPDEGEAKKIAKKLAEIVDRMD